MPPRSMTRCLSMNTQIVVAGERERLTAEVLEARVDLRGEVIVVLKTLVTPQDALDREEVVVRVGVDAGHALHRQEHRHRCWA